MTTTGRILMAECAHCTDDDCPSAPCCLRYMSLQRRLSQGLGADVVMGHFLRCAECSMCTDFMRDDG